MPTRWMQVYKRSSGYQPVLPQPFDFSHYAGYPSKPLMRIDVKRREIWEWRDHTHNGLDKVPDGFALMTMGPGQHLHYIIIETSSRRVLSFHIPRLA